MPSLASDSWGMMTLALDASHDLFTGSRSGIAIATDGAAVAQGVLTRLKLFLGEWYLDANAGTPWFEKILTDSPDIRVIERELKKQILADPAVLSLLLFDLDFNRSTRGITFSFQVDTVFGPSVILELTQ